MVDSSMANRAKICPNLAPGSQPNLATGIRGERVPGLGAP